MLYSSIKSKQQQEAGIFFARATRLAALLVSPQPGLGHAFQGIRELLSSAQGVSAAGMVSDVHYLHIGIYVVCSSCQMIPFHEHNVAFHYYCSLPHFIIEYSILNLTLSISTF